MVTAIFFNLSATSPVHVALDYNVPKHVLSTSVKHFVAKHSFIPVCVTLHNSSTHTYRVKQRLPVVHYRKFSPYKFYKKIVVAGTIIGGLATGAWSTFRVMRKVHSIKNKKWFAPIKPYIIPLVAIGGLAAIIALSYGYDRIVEKLRLFIKQDKEMTPLLFPEQLIIKPGERVMKIMLLDSLTHERFPAATTFQKTEDATEFSNQMLSFMIAK